MVHTEILCSFSERVPLYHSLSLIFTPSFLIYIPSLPSLPPSFPFLPSSPYLPPPSSPPRPSISSLTACLPPSLPSHSLPPSLPPHSLPPSLPPDTYLNENTYAPSMVLLVRTKYAPGLQNNKKKQQPAAEKSS